MLISDDAARAMYEGNRGNATARRFARFWERVIGLGLMPRRWVVLEVTGRRSGRPVRFPLGMADVGGHWYLVSMLGNDSNWVRNVRAADGQVTLHNRRHRACRLVEVPAAERAAIIKRYVQKAPGARPHIPVDRHAPVIEFEAVAPCYPIFRVLPGRTAPKPHRTNG